MKNRKSGKAKSPVIPLSSIERSLIMGALMQGARSCDIAARLGVRNMQVAAINAHMTMGNL